MTQQVLEGERVKYLSLFTGIGGFELGITQAYEANLSIRNGEAETAKAEAIQPRVESAPKGNELRGNLADNLSSGNTGSLSCIGFSEIDKYATQIYQKHFPTHTNYGDITKINAEDLPDFDFLCGGFPCQSFSIAGKRGGFSDTRGTLFFDIARILKVKRPRLCLLENVKGLLSHDEGRTFATIISTLDELGYDLQWEVLNSKNFGVPQNRERVFIVGHLRGTSRPKVFPFGEGYKEYAKGLKQFNNPKFSSNRIYLDEGISPGIRTMQGGNLQPKILSKTVRSGGRASPHGSKQNWDSYEYKGAIRRLTPKECERLQGFPDDWTAAVSDSQRYKCCGNAVTVNVIQAIMERLL